ncbi:MAG: hypothetical protein Ct9H90mP16_15360 [Candidatus Poseidoniales archaeon]|nr:MAG: hypothetical protein Ct9H90mP16_15360 [Candidatus Poseidoniales archaeon]
MRYESTQRKTKEEVVENLHDVAREMYKRMAKGEAPTMTLPVRTKNNFGFDNKLGVYKYGSKRSIRDATSLGEALANCYGHCTSLNSLKR